LSETKYEKARVEYTPDNGVTVNKIQIQRLDYREIGAEERIYIADSVDLQSIHISKRCLEFEFVTKGEVDRTLISPWEILDGNRKLRFVLTKPDGTEVNKELQQPVALLGVDVTKGLGGEVLEETWRGVAKAGFV